METASFSIPDYLETKKEIKSIKEEATLLIDVFAQQYKSNLSNYSRPDFMEKSLEFLAETDAIIYELNLLGQELREQSKKEKIIFILTESSARLFSALRKTYPLICSVPSVRKSMDEFDVLKFPTTQDVINHLLVLLNTIYNGNKMSNRKPLHVADYFNLDHLEYLLSDNLPIDEKWLIELLNCFMEPDFVQNNRLIRQTPHHLMEFAGKLFTELHGLSIDKILKT